MVADYFEVDVRTIDNYLSNYEEGNYSGTPDLTINIRKREAFATLI